MTDAPKAAHLPSTRDLAEALLRAEATGTLVETPRGGPDPTMDEAYELGARIARTRLRQGWRFCGWKVGFTNREIWPRWGLDRPMVAPVYRETVFSVGEDGPGKSTDAPLAVPAGRRAALRIEVEVVFGFGGTGETEEGVADGAMPKWVAVGAELVDCHYPGWDLHPARSVADFGLHAGLVVGPRVGHVSAETLRSLDRVTVSLSAGGERLSEGVGDAVLGGPANVLAELRGSLAGRVAGYGVTGPGTGRDTEPASRNAAAVAGGGAMDRGQGYLVSTGTLTPLVEASIGTTYEVEADLLPSFSFALV